MNKAFGTIALALLLAACADEPDAGTTPPTGEQVYGEPFDDGNTFACETCHALSEPAADGFRRAGHSLADAAARPSYKDGKLSELRDAVNSCVTEWMTAPALAEDDPRWTALRDWLTDMAPATAPAVDIQIVDPPADLSGGDADAGRAIFDASCAKCHGAGATGTNLAPLLAGTNLDPAYIAQRIRLSGDPESPTYDGLVSGRMPFWGADRLSDPELVDIAAFLATSEAVAPSNNGATGNNGFAPRTCDATHPSVGQSLSFTTRAHGVAGTATIVDDCTIEVTGFVFDGNGIEVRVYAGLDANYGGGFPVSNDLFNFPTGYDDATLTLTLPEGRSLDELDGLSVWCVAVGISFGDGQFQ